MGGNIMFYYTKKISASKSIRNTLICTSAKKSASGSTRMTHHSCAAHKHLANTIITSSLASMVLPLTAQAGVTPSLKNLLNSVVAGGLVLAAIVSAVVTVSNFDPVDRA